MKKLGFYKLFTVSPKIHLGNVKKNVEEHLKTLEEIKEKSKNEHSIILFPELSITGYSCEDLFLTESLISNSIKGLENLRISSKKHNQLIIVGTPIQYRSRLYNSACVIYKGDYIHFYLKSFLPNNKEFNEKKWFSSGIGVNDFIYINNKKVSIGPKHLIKLNDLIFGVEICEDLFSPKTPSTELALSGAHLILNLSASNELIQKDEFRRELVKSTSSRLSCGYLYCSAGPWESSKDLVFSGHMIYSEDGNVISESRNFSFNSEILETEIDIQKINHERRKNVTFQSNEFEKIETSIFSFEETKSIKRNVSKFPFLPIDSKNLEKRTQDIVELQSIGLARRILSISEKTKIVLGLSGGKDSALALIVAIEACKKLNKPFSDIFALSLPGFGTTQETRENSKKLAKAFGVSFQEIDIKESVSIHLKAIDHEKIDVVYENAQARERTQILLDYANKIDGIMIGSSTLSESFIGFCTYGGDQIANYNVSSSVPKTLVKFILQNYKCSEEVKKTIISILETPISPELLPFDENQKITQETEKIVGPYELIDFYIYHFLRNGFSNEKICFLANLAFKDKYKSEEIFEVFEKTYKRFRQNQFKRTCSPPGVKIGLSLSPRGDLRLPDEYSDDRNEDL